MKRNYSLEDAFEVQRVDHCILERAVAKQPLKAGEWYHVFVTYDGSGKAAGLKVYINGAAQPTNVEADSLKGSRKTKVPFKIGQRHSAERLKDVAIQDLRLYEKQLKGSEVEQIARSSKAAEFLAKPAAKRKRAMRNPREGWGLTNDGTSLIFSDGGPSFYFADPATFAIKQEVKIKTDRPGDVFGLNELELVDGKLYGNLFQSQTIVRIDPHSGCVEARANMGSLWRSFSDADKKQVMSEENVLNGIAYDAAGGLFYVTGKRWRTIFAGKFIEPK